MSDTRLRILIVDDQPGIRSELSGRFEQMGHMAEAFATAERALAAIGERTFDVAFIDLNLGAGMDGLEFLRQARADHPDLTVILFSAQGSIRDALEAIRLGAYDFLEKPIDVGRLNAMLERLTERSAERRALRAAMLGGVNLIGDSEGMKKLLGEIERIAPTNGRVLITGESGSGKEEVARAIHLGSRRAGGPFVKLNCAAIPKELIESELFGHERGAFTGAVQTKQGKLELADHGTLFLDEVGDLSLEAQAKLLRAIETGEVERVGGTRTARVDVRLVSATHKDLAACVRAGTFREDLYFRLNVLPIEVPPLRERREDIAPLARHFVHQFAGAEGLGEKELSAEALQVMRDYSWPGNVRELRNLMERAVILAPGPEIQAEDLVDWLVPVTRQAPAGIGEGAEGGAEPGAAGAVTVAGLAGMGGREGEPATLREEIERREAEAIVKVLEASRWNVTQAAAQLGVDRTNLHRKMRKYGISRTAKEDEA